MAYTEQDYLEILQRVKAELQNDSQGIGEVPTADTLEGITSLPAYQPTAGQDVEKVVRAPLSFLAAPALEASKIANEEEAKRAAAETGRVDAESARVTEFGKLKTESEKATGDANAAANRVDDSITDISTEKQAAIEATAKADAASVKANASAENADAKALLANLAAAAANSAASYATEKGDYADDAGATALEAVGTLDAKMQEKINALIANAPEALDTLVELAAALGNDPNFAATMAKELAKKINVADIINNLTTGGANKVASAEMVKQLNNTKLGSSFFATLSAPMTSDEFGAITNPDPTTLYVVTLPD